MAIVFLALGASPLTPQSPKIEATQHAQSVYTASALGITSRTTVTKLLGAPFPDSFEVTTGGSSPVLRKTLTNCADYLEVRDQKFTTGLSIDDTTLRALGAKCVALDWIRDASPATHPSFRDFSFRRVTVRELPPEFALSLSRQQRSAAKSLSHSGGSILDLEPGLRMRVTDANRATLISPDWTEALSVYSHADFIGDGQEELLMRADAKATGGSYISTTLFLLVRRNNGLVVVRQYPDVK